MRFVTNIPCFSDRVSMLLSLVAAFADLKRVPAFIVSVHYYTLRLQLFLNSTL